MAEMDGLQIVARPSSHPAPYTVIRPSSRRARLDLKEIWEYRELLYFLAWRDIKVRYKQTAIGVLWAIIQPFMTMVLFSLVFGRIANISSGSVPYPVFAYAALVPWTFFASSLTASTNAVTANARMLSKVYFPRVLLPISAVTGALLDFGIALSLLIVLMFYFQVSPTPSLLFFPFFVLMLVVMALAGGLWLAALNALYQDVRYAVPFLIQIWLFASPVAYPSSLVPPSWRVLYECNPLAGIIEGIRWTVLSGPQPSSPALLLSALMTTALLAGGVLFFHYAERTFADTL